MENLLPGASRALTHPARRCSSVNESILDQRPGGDRTIAPRDFLAFVVLASIIRDRHFKDAVSALEHLGRNLRLQLETLRAQWNAFDHVGSKSFITRFHVAQNGVVQ